MNLKEKNKIIETLKSRALRTIYDLNHKDNINIENLSDDAYCYIVFCEMYGSVPNVMYFFDEKEYPQLEEIDPDDVDEDDYADADISEIATNLIKNYGVIDNIKTTENIINKYPCFVYTWKGNKMIFTEDFILFKSTIFAKFTEKPKALVECIVEEKNERANLKYVSLNNQGNFDIRKMPINAKEVNIQENYNDDFPYEKIEEIINKNESSLTLLYGMPGTGKTYFIRKLIRDNPDINFYWLDSSMFSMINSTAFMSLLFEVKNSVFVLEDCEVILKDRETNYNTLITPILNISDGMLGDSLNLKFICTFNSDLNNIDKALLRKGRLKLKYEFKKLAKEKVQALWDKLGIKKTATEALPLCDIFNQEDNGVVKEHKIGF